MTVIGTPDAGLLMSLSEVQTLFGKQGLIRHVVISNKGDSVSGASRTEAVIDGLRPTLDRLGLAIEPTKRDDLKSADDAGAMFSTFFITFGSFSIAAGILLIFLLFVMLAGERKPEMGIARAVGTERVHLVEMFMFEGVLYDVVAAAIGALIGVGVALAMVCDARQRHRAVRRRPAVRRKHPQPGHVLRHGCRAHLHRRYGLGLARQSPQHRHGYP